MRVTDLRTDRTSDAIEVTATIRNVGPLPTNVTAQALLAGTANPVLASIELEGATLVGGQSTVDLGHLPGNSSSSGVRQARWQVRVNDRNASATVVVLSDKGGTHRRTVSLSQ